MRSRREIWISAAAVLIPVVSLGAWPVVLQMTGNIHTIAPGVAYRSNTLGTAQLENVIQGENIRTIINLRGGSSNDGWYRAERQTGAHFGVTFIDIPMHDDQVPSPQTLNALLNALHTAPRPFLIHCKAGADRTGLAAALFSLVELQQPADVADDQLSFRYGHFPWLGSPTMAMDVAFADYVTRPSLDVAHVD